MATGDLYKAVAHISVWGEDCQNRFWFRQGSVDSSTPNQAQMLAGAIQAYFFDPLGPLLGSQATLDYIEVWNYTDGTEYYLLNDGTVGTSEDAPTAPSQWCVGIKYARPQIGWQYPRKRISGFPVQVFGGNDVVLGIAGDVEDIGNAIRAFGFFAASFTGVIIREGSGFGLGNAVVAEERSIGTVVDVYDASQMTRKN